MNFSSQFSTLGVAMIPLLLAMVSLPAQSQEPKGDLTLEEIVARNEATWKKLENIAVRGTSRQLVHYTMLSRDEAGRDVPLEGIREEVHNVRLLTRGLDQSIFSEQNHKDFPESPKEREWRIGGFARKTHGLKQVHISKDQFASPGEVLRFGRNLNRACHFPVTSLRDWALVAKPIVTAAKNEQGEACWRFEGKLQTKVPPGYDFVVDQTDEVTVVINAERGFLIERIEFSAAQGSPMPSATWRVHDWKAVADQFFPAKIRIETTVAKAKNLAADDGKRWSEWEVSEVKLNPPDLEQAFEVQIPEGALVHDLTDRAGVNRVAIWGDDDKPARVFATKEEYDAFEVARRKSEEVKFLQSIVVQLFPNCTVEEFAATPADSLHFVVRDQDGAVIREFNSEDEIRICALVQLYVAQLAEVTTKKK